ncbi:DUF2946 family protein [Acinetobacter larvae]|uniref:DUF2946 domain-containing protein n=1 Tax=Acinetobacter larvae TaxID=1789224 RepID=A0A1B2M2U0_9GAMM|nr:DUF2946 family protein [Acinetobacter larvae]AOA59507.1 DUF2946 domain-containing protein [Acinetobacter larvae]
MNVLLGRCGIFLGFAAVLLQIAVFLQPLLPPQFQIAPVCETISQALQSNPDFQNKLIQQQHSTQQHSTHHHNVISLQTENAHSTDHQGHHHDLNHQCQYCTVYGNLVLPPELDQIKVILDRIIVRLLAFQHAFRHIYFALQRLFLIPQGRAPPLFA